MTLPYDPSGLPETHDQVDHPAHYNTGRIEVIEFIEDQKLGYHLGNALKYITRAGKKNPDKTWEDIEKAVWYLRRYQEVTSARETGETPKRPNEMDPAWEGRNKTK